MFFWAIRLWDALGDEKKSLLHFFAHIIEFALILVVVVVYLKEHYEKMQRLEIQAKRVEQWEILNKENVENNRLYKEWLLRVREKDGLLDSLAKTTERTPP